MYYIFIFFFFFIRVLPVFFSKGRHDGNENTTGATTFRMPLIVSVFSSSVCHFYDSNTRTNIIRVRTDGFDVATV